MCGLFSTQALAFEAKCGNGKQITPAELLMAIYVNHQTNNLGYKIIQGRTLTISDMERLVREGKEKHNGFVKAIDDEKLPIQLNFSHWPTFDIDSVNRFNSMNAGYRFSDGDALSLYKKKKLENIVDRYCNGSINITVPLTKDEITDGIWRTYDEFKALKPQKEESAEGPGKPETTLVLAIDEILKKIPGTMNHLTAIDLGCGAGRDTLELLKKGFKVYAIDSNQKALDRLESHAPQDAKLNKKIDIRNSSFAGLDLMKMTNNAPVQLLNASWSLPYANANFDHAMTEVKKMLEKGGVFAGQFFGENDDLKHEMSDTRLMKKQEMEQLFPESQYKRILWESKEYDDKRVDGSTKHWHVWHVVVEKLQTE